MCFLGLLTYLELSRSLSWRYSSSIAQSINGVLLWLIPQFVTSLWRFPTHALWIHEKKEENFHNETKTCNAASAAIVLLTYVKCQLPPTNNETKKQPSRSFYLPKWPRDQIRQVGGKCRYSTTKNQVATTKAVTVHHSHRNLVSANIVTYLTFRVQHSTHF